MESKNQRTAGLQLSCCDAFLACTKPWFRPLDPMKCGGASVSCSRSDASLRGHQPHRWHYNLELHFYPFQLARAWGTEVRPRECLSANPQSVPFLTSFPFHVTVVTPSLLVAWVTGHECVGNGMMGALQLKGGSPRRPCKAILLKDTGTQNWVVENRRNRSSPKNLLMHKQAAFSGQCICESL